MKKLLGIVVLGLFVLSNFAYSRTKAPVSISDLKDEGYKLTHSFRSGGIIYFIFENENHVYECVREAGYNSIKCYHLTDGK